MSVAKKIRALVRRGKLDGELDEEMRFHVERRTQDNIATGMNAKEAREAALRAFGGVGKMTERCRDARGVQWLESVGQDFRYAIRTLSKDRRFALLAILALALGIGAATVIFSTFQGLLLNILPYKNPGQLVTFEIREPNKAYGRELFTIPEIMDYREQNHVFEDSDATFIGRGSCTYGKTNLAVWIEYTTSNTLSMLGVKPAVGTLPPAGDPGDPSPVFEMSYAMWRDEFNSDPKILGKTFICDSQDAATSILNGVPRKLVAIMPLRMTTQNTVWIPFPLNRSAAATDPLLSTDRVNFTGRLKPGTSVSEAGANLDIIAHRLAAAYPRRYPKQFRVIANSLMSAPGGGRAIEKTAMAFGLAALILLWIACNNVANLLLSRATVRDREMAVRASIGASRGRLVRQLLVESFVLAGGAGICACFFAYYGLKALVPFLSIAVLPEPSIVRLSWEALLFSLGVTILCATACGLSPALRAVRGELQARLMGAEKGRSPSLRHGKLRASLVVGEVALSIVLMISAGVMLHIFFELTHADMGFNAKNLIQVTVPSGYGPAQQSTMMREALQQAMIVPGVRFAGLSATWPGGAGVYGSDVSVTGAARVRIPYAQYSLVSDGYFATIGEHLLRGRLLSADDMASARRVAVVNQTFARWFFPNGNPIGQTMSFKRFERIPTAPHNATFEIVGVVSDTRGSFDVTYLIPQLEQANANVFLPYTVMPSVMDLYVRTSKAPRVVIPAIREQIHKVDASAPLAQFLDMDEVIHRMQRGFTAFCAVVLGTFAAIGLLLVLVGIFSVMAYTVSLQTREIGIRMAFGAQRRDVLRMVLMKGSLLMAAGLGIGLFASFALTRLVGSHVRLGKFNGVMITDPWTFGAVILLIAVTGLAACYFPARRAADVDPLVALRHE